MNRTKTPLNDERAAFEAALSFAESEGFEPPDLLQSTVFKTAAFDHSANSPAQKYKLCDILQIQLYLFFHSLPPKSPTT